MPEMVCVKCSTELCPEKNGVFVVKYADFGPYQIFSADLWKCSQCLYEIVAGLGKDPIREHYNENFNDVLIIIKNSGKPIINNYGRYCEYKKGASHDATHN